jgi:hypothetical protein
MTYSNNEFRMLTACLATPAANPLRQQSLAQRMQFLLQPTQGLGCLHEPVLDARTYALDALTDHSAKGRQAFPELFT